MRQEEDMVVGRYVTVASCALAAALAGCVSMTRSSLASSADQLQQNAQLLSEDAAYAPSYAPPRGADAFTRDSRALAVDAHDFRRTVEDSRADSPDIRLAFDHLSRSYHAVRDEVNHSDNLQAQRDFRPVADAYRDIERELGIYPEGAARADYPSAPAPGPY
jgi:hypothetical protein